MNNYLDLDLDTVFISQNKPFNILDIVFLFIMSGCFMLFLIQCFLSFGCNKLPYIKDVFTQPILGSSVPVKERKEEEEIIIIRGVPGAGKKHLVYHMEKEFDDGESFFICDRNDYFITNENFKFNPKYLRQAEQQLRMNFIMALDKTHIKRVYVIGYFEEFWMYEEFVKLGELYNNKVRVIDLRCPNEEHLIYFNKRSKMSPPLVKSKKCFKVWEHNPSAYIQEPYIEPFYGDCLPKYNSSEINKSDIDFDNYKNEECMIDSDDEFDNTYYSYEDNGDHIEYVSKEDIEDILENQITL